MSGGLDSTLAAKIVKAHKDHFPVVANPTYARGSALNLRVDCEHSDDPGILLNMPAWWTSQAQEYLGAQEDAPEVWRVSVRTKESQ